MDQSLCTISDHLNKALLMCLIAQSRMITQQHGQLIVDTNTNTTTYTFPQFRQGLQDAMCRLLQSATCLQKDLQIIQVMMRNIHTSLLCSSESYTGMHWEIETWNHGVTLCSASRWLTNPEQPEGKQAISIVLSIVRCHLANDLLITTTK